MTQRRSAIIRVELTQQDTRCRHSIVWCRHYRQRRHGTGSSTRRRLPMHSGKSMKTADGRWASDSNGIVTHSAVVTTVSLFGCIARTSQHQPALLHTSIHAPPGVTSVADAYDIISWVKTRQLQPVAVKLRVAPRGGGRRHLTTH